MDITRYYERFDRVSVRIIARLAYYLDMPNLTDARWASSGRDVILEVEADAEVAAVTIDTLEAVATFFKADPTRVYAQAGHIPEVTVIEVLDQTAFGVVHATAHARAITSACEVSDFLDSLSFDTLGRPAGKW